jgi:hypothetical protein
MEFEVHKGNNKEFKPKCTVQLDSSVNSFEDFIVIGFTRANGSFTVVHNADILTLATGLEVLAQHIRKMYADLSSDEKLIIDEFFESKGVKPSEPN